MVRDHPNKEVSILIEFDNNPKPTNTSTIEITPELKKMLNDTRDKLKGSDRRIFMAQFVASLGRGGQSRAELELGWDRKTIRKGMREYKTNIVCLDNFQARGRKRAEAHLPNLLNDIKNIVKPVSQADPTFRTTKIYSPLTAEEVHKRLIEDKHYTQQELPTPRTIRSRLNELNFHPQKVNKTKPKKKLRR